jgi:predicted porin
MKKTLIVGAVIAAFTTAAAAQQASSVTLYGIADINVAQSETHAGATITGIDQVPNPRGSRFGMRGSENLGGGMRAIFQLEAGLSMADGTTTANSQLFNRHAWVGLTGGFGELTVGRQDTLHRTMNLGNYSDVATEGELSVTTSNSGLQLMQNFGSRVNNAIRYTSPTMSGVQVRVQSAIGQRATASTNGILVTYNQGPLRAAIAHEYYDGAGVAGPSRWNEVTTIGGQYNLGFATLALGYQTTDKLLAANTATATSNISGEHSAYNIGLIYPVTKALGLRVQYTQSTTKTPAVGTTAATSRDYSRIGVSTRYAFSGRTFGYVAYNQRDVDVPTATANKSSFGVGISHAF